MCGHAIHTHTHTFNHPVIVAIDKSDVYAHARALIVRLVQSKFAMSILHRIVNFNRIKTQHDTTRDTGWIPTCGSLFFSLSFFF